ncbi:unnamed protein product [Somion occarium]|uniref:Protein kinase domain-containing protein n=1 Tax=Somion occarium TaxID=3059160 RepID=A0ABP1E2M1_9APHY
MSISYNAANRGSEDLYHLLAAEIPWRNRQKFLASKGYMLRPRYHPGRIPSWMRPFRRPADLLDDLFCEDRRCSMMVGYHSMDATRMSDGTLVCLKTVKTDSERLRIPIFFSSKELRDDPRNHCVPILDVLPDSENEDQSILVMPFLRKYNCPEFETVYNVTDYVDQMLEGLAFFHEHGVVLGSFLSMDDNVLDASELYPSGFHPEFQDSPRDGPCYKTCPRKSRITTPVKYYWSDFMSAARIVPKDNTEYGRGEKDDVIRAPRKMVKNWNLCGITDPFKHDVFVFGITLKYGLSQQYLNLGFLRSLVKIMTNNHRRSRGTKVNERMLPDNATVALQRWRRSRAWIFPLHAIWRPWPWHSENPFETLLKEPIYLVRNTCLHMNLICQTGANVTSRLARTVRQRTKR